MEAAVCKRLCRTRAGEMNYRGQLLPPLPADFCSSPRSKYRRDVPVQQHRRQFGGAARHDPRIKRTRRATVLDDVMVENAIAFHLRKGRVGHLVHADAARGRLVHRERIPGQTPSPIGVRDWIASALDLGERGQQFGRDRAGGIFSKEGRISAPSFDRGFIELAAYGRKHLRRLVQDLINEIRCRKDGQHGYGSDDDPHRRWNCLELT
jgi:hypothetical protein